MLWIISPFYKGLNEPPLPPSLIQTPPNVTVAWESDCPEKSSVPSSLAAPQKSCRPWTRRGNVTRCRCLRAKKKKNQWRGKKTEGEDVKMKFLLPSLSWKGFRTWIDGGHHSPSAVLHGPLCLLETIGTSSLKVSLKTADLSLFWLREMLKQYQKCCFESGQRSMNNKWRAVFVPPVLSSLMAIDVSSFHHIWDESPSPSARGERGGRGRWSFSERCHRLPGCSVGSLVRTTSRRDSLRCHWGSWVVGREEEELMERFLEISSPTSRHFVRQNTNAQRNWSAAGNVHVLLLEIMEDM